MWPCTWTPWEALPVVRLIVKPWLIISCQWRINCLRIVNVVLEENPASCLGFKEKEDKVAVERGSFHPRLSRWRKPSAFWCGSSDVGRLGGSLCHRYQYGAWLGLLQPHDFEFITEIEGNELTVCAGGRYDGLVEYFGGPATAGLDLVSVWNGSFSFLKRKALNYRSKKVRCLYCRSRRWGQWSSA